MKFKLIAVLGLATSLPVLADHNIVDGFDFGPLAKLVGQWESVEVGGIDVSPARIDSGVEAGLPAVTPFYEKMTFEVAADAVNASKQSLVALYYKQEVFRKIDDTKFHDQRGYLIYDADNQTVYNSFCVPRAMCVTAESPAGDTLNFVASKNGISESNFMTDNAATTSFSMNLIIAEDEITYSQSTGLKIYGQDVIHTDASTLKRVK